MLEKVLVASLMLVGSAFADDVAPTAAMYSHHKEPATSGMWVDFGGGAERFAPGDGSTYSGQYLRFAPQTTIRRHFYVGAEMHIAMFDGDSPPPTTAALGNSSSPMSVALSGSTAGALAIGGVRAMAGVLSGGVELAVGYELTSISGNAVQTWHKSDGAVVQTRGRLDLWLSPHITGGGMVGIDLTDSHNLQAGLQVGFHFEPYDHSR